MGPQELTDSDCNNCWWRLDIDIPWVESLCIHIAEKVLNLHWLHDMFLLAGAGLQLCVHLQVLTWKIFLSLVWNWLVIDIVWVTFDMPSTVCVWVFCALKKTYATHKNTALEEQKRHGLSLFWIEPASSKSWNPLNELFPDYACYQHGEFVLPSLFPIKSPIWASYFARAEECQDMTDWVVDGSGPS